MSISLNIRKIFPKIKIKNNDLVMFHIDSAISIYYPFKSAKKKVEYLCKELINYFGKDGTIIVPTFTYSFTKKKNYNYKTSKSNVGYFSEVFRKLDNVKRTQHPLFSVAIKGKLEKKFLNCTLNDSFGKNTIFDLLFKYNGKIVCIACDLERITFVHFVEQMFGVPYRYFKTFNGTIIKNKKKYRISTKYFVRNLKENYKTDLNILEKDKSTKKHINKLRFQRFYFKSIDAKDLYKSCFKLLKKNKYSLVSK